jgi:hypothetical protein
MEKEKWKDEVLNSLHGLQKAEPNAFLFTRIEAKLERATGLSKFQVRFAGVCMVLLLAINVWVASSQSNTSTESNPNSITTTYRY